MPAPTRRIETFEEDMLKLIEELEFTTPNDDFQRTLKSDIDRIKKSNAVFVPADKTRHL